MHTAPSLTLPACRRSLFFWGGGGGSEGSHLRLHSAPLSPILGQTRICMNFSSSSTSFLLQPPVSRPVSSGVKLRAGNHQLNRSMEVLSPCPDPNAVTRLSDSITEVSSVSRDNSGSPYPRKCSLSEPDLLNPSESEAEERHRPGPQVIYSKDTSSSSPALNANGDIRLQRPYENTVPKRDQVRAIAHCTQRIVFSFLFFFNLAVSFLYFPVFSLCNFCEDWTEHVHKAWLSYWIKEPTPLGPYFFFLLFFPPDRMSLEYARQ